MVDGFSRSKTPLTLTSTQPRRTLAYRESSLIKHGLMYIWFGFYLLLFGIRKPIVYASPDEVFASGVACMIVKKD
jgi:hypothetical protein